MLRRSPRPADDRVDSDLHRFVLNRDRRCLLAKIDGRHQCRDRFGIPHAPDDVARLTVDHVHWRPGGIKGKRAPSHHAHLVAMCAAGNNKPPNHEEREAERAYLFNLYPGHGAWHGPCAHDRPGLE